MDVQTSLVTFLLDKQLDQLNKALAPGRNELTVASLRLLSFLVRDVTEPGWASRAKKVWNAIAGDGKVCPLKSLARLAEKC